MVIERPEVYSKAYRWVSDEKTILSLVTANGVGTEVDVSQFRHVCAVVIGSTSPQLTVKCQGSFKKIDEVDFSSSAGVTNPWDFIGMYDYQNANIVIGDTGVVFTGTDDVRQFEINTNGIRAINFQVSGYVAGEVTVLLYGVNNQ